MKNLFPCLLLVLLSLHASSQVKIGNNPGTINDNSILELESTNKGILPPRIALNSATSISPMTGTVPSGMLVYSSGGTLTDGYYYWNGTMWRLVATSGLNTVVKTADATLTKIETMVLASNDITLTLPEITASDNGLEISIKNIGTYADLITVEGDGSSTIDEQDSVTLTRNCGNAFVAHEGNWVIKQKVRSAENLLDVNANSSWTTLDEVIEFLGEHMSGPTVVRLTDEEYEVSSTININLPYSLTIQGVTYGNTSIIPATGLAGKPMFRCTSDTYFKMLHFDATALGSYGTAAGEDAIRFIGANTYNEVKDCSFERFYNTIIDSANAELWVFETDISKAKANGILLHSNVAGVTLKVAETDFIECKYGINLSKGSNATIQLASGGYYNSLATDTAINFQATNFTTPASIVITANSWNNTGKFIEGFDFTRADGRDANVFIENNAGIADRKPNCSITLLNGNSNTTLTTANSWYKAVWTNTYFTTTKWTIANNRITYQPNNRRDALVTITGNLSVDNASRTISVGIVKNGATGTRYGETTLRTSNANTASQFSTTVYLSDIGPGDYLELYCSSANSGDVVKILDLNLVANTQ